MILQEILEFPHILIALNTERDYNYVMKKKKKFNLSKKDYNSWENFLIIIKGYVQIDKYEIRNNMVVLREKKLVNNPYVIELTEERNKKE